MRFPSVLVFRQILNRFSMQQFSTLIHKLKHKKLSKSFFISLKFKKNHASSEKCACIEAKHFSVNTLLKWHFLQQGDKLIAHLKGTRKWHSKGKKKDLKDILRVLSCLQFLIICLRPSGWVSLPVQRSVSVRKFRGRLEIFADCETF